MARTGRPPKPTALKILHGNPGKRPLPENEPDPTPVKFLECPVDLPRLAKREWRAKVKQLAELKMLHEIDAQILTAWCLAVERLHYSAKKLRGPASYIGFTSQGESVSAWMKIQRDAIADMRALAAEFGFSPAARVRVGVTPEKKKESGFESLRDAARSRPNAG